MYRSFGRSFGFANSVSVLIRCVRPIIYASGPCLDLLTGATCRQLLPALTERAARAGGLQALPLQGGAAVVAPNHRSSDDKGVVTKSLRLPGGHPLAWLKQWCDLGLQPLAPHSPGPPPALSSAAGSGMRSQHRHPQRSSQEGRHRSRSPLQSQSGAATQKLPQEYQTLLITLFHLAAIPSDLGVLAAKLHRRFLRLFSLLPPHRDGAR